MKVCVCVLTFCHLHAAWLTYKQRKRSKTMLQIGITSSLPAMQTIEP